MQTMIVACGGVQFSGEQCEVQGKVREGRDA